MRGDDRGRKASGVAHESPRVREEEEGRETSRVVENPGGGAMKWAGESNRLRALTPLEWPRSPGGTNPPEGPQRLRADRGRTDG